MVRTFTKETSGSELVSGIVGTIDIGELLTKVIEVTKEISNTQEILDKIKNLINAQNGGFTKTISGYITQDFSKVKPNILSDLQLGLRNQASFLRDQAMNSVLGFPATATMNGLYAKLYSSFSGTSTLYDCIFGIPQEFLEDQAQRYWNLTLMSGHLNPDEALRMYRFGYMTRADWVKNKIETDGVKNDQADKLFSTFYRQPSEDTAFNLWKRGIITQSQFNEILKRLGWDSTFLATITEAYYYQPSFRDLMRLSDYMPMDTIYIGDVLRKNGVKESDIPRLTTYLQLRPLREERRGILGRLLYEHANGRITTAEFDEDLIDLQVLPAEKGLYDQWADMQYQDELMDLQLLTIEQKSIKGQYTTAEEITADIVALGIDETWANLQGWEWYWEHVYEKPA